MQKKERLYLEKIASMTDEQIIKEFDLALEGVTYTDCLDSFDDFQYLSCKAEVYKRLREKSLPPRLVFSPSAPQQATPPQHSLRCALGENTSAA